MMYVFAAYKYLPLMDNMNIDSKHRFDRIYIYICVKAKWFPTIDTGFFRI